MKEPITSIEELREIIEFSFDEIFVTDGEGYVILINKTTERNYGIKRKDILGKHVSELEEKGYFNPSMTLKAINEKKKVSGLQKTNRGKTLLVTSNPIKDKNGKIRKIITNSKDVTDFIKLQKQLKNSEEIIETYQNILSKTRTVREDFIVLDSVSENILETVAKIAKTDSTILLEGETGVGKNMIAKTIHKLSERSENEFISINCASIPDNLLETELFGYESGSFTGAKSKGKKGLIEMSNGGTLFLDEIAELPLQLQSKLLDVLQYKRVRKVGSSSYINVDARIISATNKDLKKMVSQKLFREDLFYRLNVIPISIPPLRGRNDAIEKLSKYFLKKYNAKYRYNKSISEDVIEIFKKYNWPGNIRELENLVEQLVVISNTDIINSNDLPGYILDIDIKEDINLEAMDLKHTLESLEKKIIQRTVQKYQSTYKAAKVLNVNQSTVARKLKKYNVKIEKSRR
jgi:PAS domain S-box-containing protein